MKTIESIFNEMTHKERITESSITDAMTGVLNKGAPAKVMQDICDSGQGMILLLDLDSFQSVNDVYGLPMGDKVLVLFAELIKSVTGDNDIVGKVGGDKFIIFFDGLTDPYTIKDKTEYLCNGILEAAKKLLGEDMNIPLGCSGGALYVNGTGESYKVLLAKADSALYRIKQNGKHGCCVYENTENAASESSMIGLDNLRAVFGEEVTKRGAIVADKDDFRVIYQFLMRFVKNSNWDIHMALFTLSEGTEDIDYADRFVEITAPRLRSSDVVFKYNEDQVIMLIMMVRNEDHTIPIHRAMDAWESEGLSDVSVSYVVGSLNEEEA